MKIAAKRKVGEQLGRAGIAGRIIALANNIIIAGSYIKAVERAGQIHVLVDAASCDDYWREKANIGINRESGLFGQIDGNSELLERAKSLADPWDESQPTPLSYEELLKSYNALLLESKKYKFYVSIDDNRVLACSHRNSERDIEVSTATADDACRIMEVINGG